MEVQHEKLCARLCFWVHLTLGCLAGLVILTMSVTGILLAFERQINAKEDAPPMLQSQTSAAGQAPVDTLSAKLKSSAEGVPSQLVVHSSAKAPVEARYGRGF